MLILKVMVDRYCTNKQMASERTYVWMMLIVSRSSISYTSGFFFKDYLSWERRYSGKPKYFRFVKPTRIKKKLFTQTFFFWKTFMYYTQNHGLNFKFKKKETLPLQFKDFLELDFICFVCDQVSIAYRSITIHHNHCLLQFPLAFINSKRL